MRSMRCMRMVLICAIASGFSATTVRAENIRVGGLSFRIDESWLGVGELSPDAFVATKSDANGRPAVALEVNVLSSRPLVSSARCEEVRANIQTSLGSQPDLAEVRVERVSVTSVDGVPAFRILASMRHEGRAVRQLQYLIADDRGHSFTFTTREDETDQLERSARELMGSVVLVEKPSLSATLPVFAIGVLAGCFRWRPWRRRRDLSR